MERKRMDQIQLAAALGVSRSAVNNWINDRAYPLNSIGALEAVLGISLEDDGEQPRTIPAQLRRDITKFPGVDEKTRERAIGLLEGTLTWPGEPSAPAPNPGTGSEPPSEHESAPFSPSGRRAASASSPSS